MAIRPDSQRFYPMSGPLTRARAVIPPTLAMLAVLAVASMAVFAIAVTAPAAAADLGLSTSLLGVYSALVYAVAMFSGLQTDTLAQRYGAIRVSQVTCALVAAAMLAFVLATPATALLSGLLLGIAYGQCNPASARILVELGTPRWRSLIFSVKQTGVPVGGALAGLLLPPILGMRGWPTALLAVAGLALLLGLALQTLRPTFDRPRIGMRLRLRVDVRAPLAMVLRHPELRGITLAAMVYSGAQVSIGSFFVVYLVEARALSLGLAGSVFAALQAGGVIGRILWGALAGGRLPPRRMLGLIGLLSVASLILLIQLDSDWPHALLLALGLVLGASSFGWNGVFLAENARLSPPGRVGHVTGAVQFFIYGGVVLLPPLFGLLVAVGGGYAPAFATTACLLTGASLYYLIRR